MLDAAWHLRGSVPLAAVGSDAVALDRVEQLLDRQFKIVTERGSDSLLFDDPLWRNPFGGNWLAMAIYDRGRFWIERAPQGRRLRYDLRSLHVMVFCLIAAAAAFAFVCAGGEVFLAIRIAAGAFAWLYGMNILTAVLRAPPTIRDAVMGS